MMPGENHSKSAGIASDITKGVCKNCTVLHQNLKEYVAALLILERKIIDTDHLLTEYQEKCDELQKSQRETSKLHQELDELLLKMAPLERQNEEYEAMRSELEEKKSSLKNYQQTSEELDRMKEENIKLLTSKKNLENQLKTFEDSSIKKDHEITQLEKEKTKLEENLHTTQNSLKHYQQTSEELDRMKEENMKLLSSKKNLENQLKTFEDCSTKKDHEITQLKKEKKKLEENLHTTQKNLEELELKNQKDLMNVTTQTNFPEEPKTDKAKVKQLIEELWSCIEPQSSQATSQLHFSGLPCESSDYRSDPLKSCSVSVQRTKGPPEAPNTIKTRKRSRASGELLYSNTLVEKTTSPGASLNGSHEEDIEEILDCFKPLPPLLSPVIFTSPEKALFGDLSDSSDDEKFDVDRQGTELSTRETTDVSMVSAPADSDILDFSNPCGTLTKMCVNSRDEEMNISHSEIQLCEVENEKVEHANETMMCTSDEPLVDGLSESSPGSFVKQTVCSGASTEQSTPEHTGLVKNKGSDAEDMVVVETPQKEKEIYAEVTCEKALPILPNKLTGDHQDSCSTVYSESILGPHISPLKVSSDNLGHSKDADVPSETPTFHSHLIQGSLSPCFTQPKESNETQYQNPLSTLNDTPNDDAKSEQIVSKAKSEVNSAHGPEETICFSEDNCHIDANVLDLAESTLTSKSPLCSNDGISQPKYVGPNALHSEIFTGPDVNLTPPSEPVTTSELPCRAVNSEDRIKPLEIIQNGALSEVSNHMIENVLATKECEKPNEMEVNACEEQELTQTCQVPALNLLASPSKTSSENIDNPLSRIPSCSDIKPLVETDSTPAEIPADEDRIKGSSSNDLEKYKESSDEQESFGLQRKVKTIYQRAGNQASTESEKGLTKPEQDSVVTQEDSGKNPGTSYESQGNPSEMSEKSLDSALVELDSSANGSQAEVTADSIPMEETFTAILCENQVLDALEVPLKDESKECKSNVNQSQKITDQGCSLYPEFSSELKESLCPLQADDRTDESTESKITQEVSADKPEDVKNCSLNNSRDIPTDDTQPGNFRNPTIPSRKRQHSGNCQERSLNLKDELKLTNPLMLATTYTSIPEKSPESIRKVRFKMGPPLPPLLNPLTVTPPRFGTQELQTVPSKLLIPSIEGTPIQETSIAPLMSPHSEDPNVNSPCLSISSAGDTKRRRLISSPLQFCATTPKHAVPVPGRLPPAASNSSSSSPSAPQENSVRILDTMYPELSARARTLNILRRTVNFNRCAPDTGTTTPDPVGQVSRFKAVNSSRVLTKTEQSNENEIGFNPSIENNSTSKDGSSAVIGKFVKKPGVNVLLPKSAIKLDNDSPVPAKPHGCLANHKEVSQGESAGTREDGQVGNATSAQNPIMDALKKIGTSCFDLLPVIRSHVSITKISKVPVLRDEEKEVIHEFCVVNKHLADDLLSAILVKMKTEKNTICGMYLQALCRVYTGICRQTEDWERAHLFIYSILKEDFPDSAKLILFIVTTWFNVLSQTGVLCKAIHAVLRLRAHGEVLPCLTAFLDWEKNPPSDCEKIIKSTLMALRMGVNMKFLKHDRHGDDLNHAAWTYVFTLDLLCTQQQWKWTHDNIICKELWPIMNSWVIQSRSRQTPIPDISVATTLRLIGRLGQLGIKEKSIASVKNVAKVINTFGRHGKGEGVPWPVQLAAVYTIYDLSPSNPKEAMDALAAWRGETTETVPPAVTSCITQIGSVCRYIKS
ncbi:little elongation complex subunit 1 isoform X2 [Anguilla anguilla]|nr:little elongation complex subunit 1 isoform X2 [Anguilla anguilla]